MFCELIELFLDVGELNGDCILMSGGQNVKVGNVGLMKYLYFDM